LQTLGSEKFSFLGRLEDSADTSLVGVHERNHSCENSSYIPAGTPSFLVVVGKSGTYRLADLETTIIGDEPYLRRGEGIVFRQLENSVIEALAILFFEIVETEVEVEVGLSLEDH
jgi:hypothetical protein